MDKVLNFENGIKTYLKMAERHVEAEEYEEALGCLFSALKKEEYNLDLLSDIADVYSEMGLFELSNKYWFKYLNFAPEKKASVAYEQIAINYYYMDNFWACNHYIQLKVNKGYDFSTEEIEENFSEYLKDFLNVKDNYYVAYPFDKADYSGAIKKAKRSFNSGRYQEAVKRYSAVPPECATPEDLGELAVSYFMLNEDDKVVDVCKDSIEKHGENVTAYCNLSTLYSVKGDKEKSEYYYKKALGLKNGEKFEYYRIATCAIEQRDYATAEECIKEVLKERKYDYNMWYFFAVSLINQHKYAEGEKALKEGYRICPFDRVLKYYTEYFARVNAGGKIDDKILPLTYIKAYPNYVEKKNRKIILSGCDSDAVEVMKKEENREIYLWGLLNGGDDLAKKCAFALVFSGNKSAEKSVLDLLLDPEVNDDRKRLLIFTLILSGKKEKFGVLAGIYFVKIKPRKLIFEDKDLSGLYFSAYAYAMSRAVFFDVNDMDKIAFQMNKLYNKHGDNLVKMGFTPEEVALMAIDNCHYKHLSDIKMLARLMCVEKKRLQAISAFLEGDGDD